MSLPPDWSNLDHNNDASGSTSASAPSPPLICEACRAGPFSTHYGLLSERIRYTGEDGPLTGGFLYTSSWEALVLQATAGCAWCGLILTISEEDEGRDGLINIRIGSQGSLACYGTPEDCQDLTIFINGVPRLLAYAYTTAGDPAAPYIVARNRLLDVGSPRALALAKMAIRECVHRHRDCIPPMSPAPRLPTRLLDCSDPHHPRLVATSGMRGVYIALSYVWGEDQPHKTTAARLDAYERGIELSALPQTIRDAIHVTRALGMRFLWVDSLCIIQDSIEDQHREIRGMRHIYRDAYCTIIAASASRVSEGFLHDRPPQVLSEGSDISIPFRCPRPADTESGADSAVQTGAIYISHISTRRLDSAILKPPPQYEHTEEPISTRGWAMQEYLMSRRSLIFASHTLQFRCQTTTRNVGGAYHNRANEMRLPRTLYVNQRSTRRHPSWLGELRRTWHRVVEDYTRRSITLPLDKLVACGGIAEEFQRVHKSDYLAGLWRMSLLVDLLWRRQKLSRTMRTTPRPAYRAPSWSWAAVEGGVYFLTPVPRSDTGQVGAFAEVVQCTVTLEDATLPFGRVRSSSLLLRTPLIACQWDSQNIHVGEPCPLRVSPALTELKDWINACHIASGSDAPLEDAAVIGKAYIDYQDSADIDEVWAAPIFWDRKWSIQGLLVARVADNHASDTEGVLTYRRIGLFDIVQRSTSKLSADSSTSWMTQLLSVTIELI